MYASAFVLGFHGCDRSVGEKILAGKDQLEPSGNDYDWLGTGIYFWENSPLRAEHWARFIQSRPKLMEKTHIQICVRDARSIRGYFRPRPESE